MKKQYLKVLTGHDKGSVYEVSGNRVRMGRDNDNDIIIPKDARCSRQHAYLRLTGSRNEIFNLGKNTIVVNGKRGKSFKLESGDVIQLGRTQIQFEQENPLREAKAFKEAAQAEQKTQTKDRLFYELDAEVENDSTRTCVTQLRLPDRTNTKARSSSASRRKRRSSTHGTATNPMQERKKNKNKLKQTKIKAAQKKPDFLKPVPKPKPAAPKPPHLNI